MRAFVIVFLFLFMISSQTVSLAGAPDPEDLKELKILGFSSQDKAPEFTLKDLEGKKISLDQYRGKPLMLYFWATWWPNCKRELPSLHRVYEKVRKSGLEILLINIREPPSTVKTAVKQRGYSLPVLLDRNGATTQDYGVWATPAVYLIDPNGYVIAGGIGPHNWDSPAGIRVLKSLGE